MWWQRSKPSTVKAFVIAEDKSREKKKKKVRQRASVPFLINIERVPRYHYRDNVKLEWVPSTSTQRSTIPVAEALQGCNGRTDAT